MHDDGDMSAIIWLVQTITSCLCVLRAALTDTYSNYKSFRDSQSIIRYYFVIRVFCVQGLLSEVPFFLPFGTLTIGFQSILVTDKSWAGRCPGAAGTHWSNYEEIGAYYFLARLRVSAGPQFNEEGGSIKCLNNWPSTDDMMTPGSVVVWDISSPLNTLAD